MAQDVLTAATEQSREQPSERMSALDTCRGLAILTVLFIHVSGHFLTRLHPVKSPLPPSGEWYALAIPNVDAQWAVPCFLMLSALVNALSLARNADLSRYARSRIQKALAPYLLWSALYFAIGRHMGQFQHLHAAAFLKLILTGGAWYHLYFFALVLQLYVLLPLLVPLFQKRPPVWAILLGTVALQLALYYANRFVWYRAFSGTILWHILPVALGLWLFSQNRHLKEKVTTGRWGAGLITLTALIVYSPIALHVAAFPRLPVNTFLYQIGEWGYTAGMSFLMLALAFAMGRNKLTRLLEFFGAESLAIYVMHPLAILALDKLGVNKTLGVAPGLAVYYAACLTLPLLAAAVWTGMKRRLDSQAGHKV